MNQPTPEPQSTNPETPVEEPVRLGQVVRWLLAALLLFAGIGVWSQVPSLDQYLSDMDTLTVVSWEWAEPRMDASIDGNSMLIGERFYSKGVGVHANTELAVSVPGGYRYFTADVGVDDEVGEDLPATLSFRVYGDGVVLYESPVMRPQDPARRFFVDIRGVNELRLVCTDMGDGNIGDHGNWAIARFTR